MREEKKLSCREAVEQLWAYIDGELPPDQGQEVYQHLGACRSCHPKYDFQKAFREFLLNRSRECIPPSLRRRIFLRLLAEEAHTDSAVTEE